MRERKTVLDLLHNKSIKVSEFFNGRPGGNIEVLLFDFTSLWALVSEDEVNLRQDVQFAKREMQPHEYTNLGTRTSKIRTKHDNPRGSIREFLSAGLEAILEEFDIATSTVAALLVLNLILHNKRLVGERDGLGKGRRDGVVGCLALGHQTTLAFNDRDGRLLNFPLADVAESFTPNGGLLCCFGGCPAFSPVFRELLDEGCL
jgi:hypothetical protein